MSGTPGVFTQDDWRAATKLAAPYQQLLETDPLWLTTTVNAVFNTMQLTAHTKTCPQLPSDTTGLRVLDPHLRYFRNSQPSQLLLCGCTMQPDDFCPDRFWQHPLRRMSGFNTLATGILSKPQDGTPNTVRGAGCRLHFARLAARSATSNAAGRPELTFWTDWLAATLASVTRHVDAMRAHQQTIAKIRLAPDDVFVTTDVFSSAGVVMSTDEAPLAVACPVQVRFDEDSTYVVRAPAALAAQRPMSSTGPEPVILGRVRPMDMNAWRLFEQLVSAGYEPVDAYGVAANSVERLDASSRRLLDPLIAARVPASELIDTAIELSR